tara:strand:- start:9738 stop:10067 length:330 start_codon:yes stop_codon:yes gene_type:complete
MSQIFKDKVDIQILIDFLDKYCTKTNNMYEINNIVFKKAKFEKEYLNKFYQDIEPFYHISKLKYIKRDRIYKNFITIIRQICNLLHISYSSKIKYSKSTYDIKYFIYLD